MINRSYYKIYVSLKLFKLFKIYNIRKSLNGLEDVIKDTFVRHKVSVEIWIQYIKAVIIFYLMIHLFACSWIFVGALEDEWM